MEKACKAARKLPGAFQRAAQPCVGASYRRHDPTPPPPPKLYAEVLYDQAPAH